MPSVTQKIENYLGGVSKQPDDRKFPGQVSEILNGLPDVTFGLTKRPGFEFISTLKTGSASYYDNAKWFYIARDDDEKYIGCIRYGSPGPATIEIWNSDGTSCTVNYTSPAQAYLDATTPIDNYDIVTVQDSTIVVNREKVTAMTAAPAASTTKFCTLRIRAAEYSSQYRLRINDGTTLYRFEEQDRTTPASASTNEYVTRDADTAGSPTSATVFLNAQEILDDVEVAIARWVSGGLANVQYVRLENTIVFEMPVGYSFEAAGGVDGEFFTYYTEVVENVTDLPKEGLSGVKVKIENTSDPEASYWATFEVENGSVYGFDITTAGTGYTGATAVATTTTGNGSGLTVDTVDSGGILTSILVNEPGLNYEVGDVVTISGGGADATITLTSVFGKGIWVETIAPDVSTSFDATTMPHQLVNTALNTFTFQQIPWVDRLTGDDITNKVPTFVGQAISGCFFYSNRFGFLSQANVSMGQAGDFFNFFFKSATAISPIDPIDLNTSSVRPASLFAAVAIPSGLVLFSELEQFLLYSQEAGITPQSAVITSLSNYEVERTITPTSNGVDINFCSRAPGFLKVFNFSPRGEANPPVVTDISRVVSDYIPNTMTTLHTNSQNRFLWLLGETTRDVYLQRVYGESEDGPIQSWFKWKLPGNCMTMFMDQDELWAVCEMGNNDYVLLRGDFNRTPATTVIQAADGQLVNPAIDLYDVASSVSYDVGNLRSKCYLPFNHDPNLTPIVIVSGQGGSSGYFQEATYATDGGGDHFLAEAIDLTAEAANVLVGYLYNFQVDLPRTYFQAENGADYAAYLKIARMRFSLAQTGIAEFTLTTRGRAAWTFSEPTIYADYYLGDDVPIEQERIVTVPINQRNTNFDISLTSTSPFPVSLTAMMWEGLYSPRFYQRV